jgi:DUF971 family protein
MSTDLSAIQAALDGGDKRAARRLLKPLLDAEPTADLWWLAACACEDRGQEIGCLRRALKLDSRHPAARLRYNELRQDALMPALDALVDELPPLELLTAEPEPARRSVDIHAIKAAERQRKNRRWTRLGCAASLLMSLSMSYFVLTVTGSPLTAQFRRIISGEAPVAPVAGQPIFGNPAPTSETRPGLPANIDATPIPDVVEVTVSGPLPTPDGNSQTYADDAAAAGFQVQPNKSVPVKQGNPVSDVLDPGYAHEYTFNATAGDEIAIAIQFFSPTATQVDANVAVVDSDGVNAEAHCQRDNIFIDGSGTAFICQIHKGGTWKLQVFGRDGQSTGVYVVTYERF